MLGVRRIMVSLPVYVTGMLCLLYALYFSTFAEVHVQLPVLDFPIFVGEIILIFLFPFLCVKLAAEKKLLSRPIILWGIYLTWMVGTAMYGYWQYGPLAFRNAALFYYPVYALIVYHFSKPIVFSGVEAFLALLLLMAVLISGMVQHYFWPTLFFLALILMQRIPSNPLRWMLAALLLWLGHGEEIFMGSRSDLVGTFMALAYLTIAILIMVRTRSIYLRTGLAAGVVFFIVAGTIAFSDRNALRTFVAFDELKALYQRERKSIHNIEYRPIKLQPKLYNDNQTSVKTKSPVPKGAVPAAAASSGRSEPSLVNDEAEESQSVGSSSDEQDGGRHYNYALINILFRIFIWEDMWQELSARRALFGVGFGQPQRSPTLEKLNWGTSEWKRDGWITPHNSFFHLVYRAGIVGVGIIVVMGCYFFIFSRTFIGRKSLTGILLVASLTHWMGLANFLLILELPHTAIPFWSLFGLAAAYEWKLRHDKKA